MLPEESNVCVALERKKEEKEKEKKDKEERKKEAKKEEKERKKLEKQQEEVERIEYWQALVYYPVFDSKSHKDFCLLFCMNAKLGACI